MMPMDTFLVHRLSRQPPGARDCSNPWCRIVFGFPSLAVTYFAIYGLIMQWDRISVQFKLNLWGPLSFPFFTVCFTFRFNIAFLIISMLFISSSSFLSFNLIYLFILIHTCYAFTNFFYMTLFPCICLSLICY